MSKPRPPHPLRQAAAAALIAFWGSAAAADPAPTPPAKDFRLIYDIYLGGVPIAEGQLTARITDATYFAETKVQAVGILRDVVDGYVVSRTQGSRPQARGAVDTLAPGVFQLRSKVRDEKFDMRMDFANDAPSAVQAEPVFKKKSYEIDPTAQTGALDPISAIVKAFLPAASGDVCLRTFPVFDGRRRFDVSFEGAAKRYDDKGEQFVECKGVVERVAGFSPKMMQRRRFPFFARFRLAADGAPQATHIWGRTDFGLATATLRR